MRARVYAQHTITTSIYYIQNPRYTQSRFNFIAYCNHYLVWQTSLFLFPVVGEYDDDGESRGDKKGPSLSNLVVLPCNSPRSCPLLAPFQHCAFGRNQ